ncbi:MAG: hypothetical protein RLZZ303_1468 [Candidatus Hydrogenedentota bacterium]
MLTENQLLMVNQWQRKALSAGMVFTAVTLILSIVASFFSEVPFLDKMFQPFLVAWIFWLGLGVCSLAVVFLHHLCGGAWSYTVQRFVEAGSRTLPFFFVTGIVIVLGGAWLSTVYPWTDEAYIEKYHIVANKAAFLNLPTFTLAYLVYFGLWMFAAMIYNGWSKRLDETADVRIIGKMKFWAGPGAVMYVLSITLAATHWVMSLEPEWFSTIYGAWMIASYALSVVSFCVIMLSFFMDEAPIKDKISTRTFHHLGNFMLGFTIFWSYVSFSQFLLIWNANLPEEIGFYLRREGDSLNVITVMLVAFHWFIPMFILLIRKNKTNIRVLRKVAIYVFCVRLLDMYWNMVPSFPDAHYRFNFMTAILVVTAVLGLGGFWFYLYLNELKKRPLLAVNDPRGELMFLKDAHGHA